MVEHQPWKGVAYEQGIDGERIMIVGNSHYGESDSDDLTCKIVSEVISGDQALPFFTNIMKYFRYESHHEFWTRVVFLNYLPERIGNASERYGLGTDEQVNRAAVRLIRLIGGLKPTKIFAFTNSDGKGWQTFPKTDQEKAGGQTLPLKGFNGFRWGTYTVKGHVAIAFGLRHPRGADGETMRRAVQHILAI
jgi:hypothetical protein